MYHCHFSVFFPLLIYLDSPKDIGHFSVFLELYQISHLYWVCKVMVLGVFLFSLPCLILCVVSEVIVLWSRATDHLAHHARSCQQCASNFANLTVECSF